MPINAVSNNQIVIGDVNPEVGINPGFYDLVRSVVVGALVENSHLVPSLIDSLKDPFPGFFSR